MPNIFIFTILYSQDWHQILMSLIWIDLDFDVTRLIFITLLLVGVEQWFRETLFLCMEDL